MDQRYGGTVAGMAQENHRVGAAITAPKVRVLAAGNLDLGPLNSQFSSIPSCPSSWS